MLNLNSIYKEMIDFLQSRFKITADIALILGSGLGDFAENLEVLDSISTADIPGYPVSTVVGHKGKILFAKLGAKTVLLFQGRIHYYEGYPIHQCVLPVFIAHKFGCKKIILTNAAGGINPNFVPGDLMLINSVHSLALKNDLSHLIGYPNAESITGIRKMSESSIYSKIKEAALEENINLKEGVYWYSKGPSYETPSEIKMMWKFGGDAVGMSTVHEQIYAVTLGMETGSISCITNLAAGISSQKLSHEEVTETANMVKNKFERLIKRSIELI